MKNQGFSKEERLKSIKVIGELFQNGQSLFKYPIKIVYTPLPPEKFPVYFGVSVSKKRFKTAVKRNRIKRLMREAYRTQKAPLWKLIEEFEPKSSYAMMAIYVGKEELPLTYISKSMNTLLSLLGKEVAKNPIK